jgi:GntR family transcriptional regulator/MocR family aminotransferase
MSWITLDRQSSIPLIRQIYDQLRSRILGGSLRSGTRLPSSRELAARLHVSRNVVMEAYDLLYAEGFTCGRHGSGTYIAEGATYSPSPPSPSPALEGVSMGYDSPSGVINFKPGTPDLRQFPTRVWLRMLREVYARADEELLGYGRPEGRPELRKAIRDYLVSRRGVVCHPDQIVVTAGTTQAIGIACSLLLGESRHVVLEDPITRDIQLIIQREGGIIHPVGTDDAGLITDELPEGVMPAFIYVTPSHQFPLGGTLTIQRRIALLEYAERIGAPVIEDDYDSEFRFDGPPLNSLQSLAPERVIYIGTFSKTLFPALRTGYLILPQTLIDKGRGRKWLCDLHNETASQIALAEFINQGHYLRHTARMRRLYSRKRRLLEKCLEKAFSNGVRIIGSAAGLHLAAQFQGVVFDAGLLAELEDAGVRVYPAEMHAIQAGRCTDTLIIGYGNLDEGLIREGVEILRKVLERVERQALKTR